MLNKKPFTLIEIMISSIIAVLAMMAIVGALSTTSQQTTDNSDTIKENQLITGAYEKIKGMTFTQVATWLSSNVELSNAKGNGPIIGDDTKLTNLPDWKQTVSMKYLNPANLTAISATPTNYMEVTIQVFYKNVLKREIKCQLIN